MRAFRKPAAAEGDFFGGAVAMVAGNVVVGAPLDDTVAVDAGALYLFDRPTGAPLLTLVDPAAGARDQFGRGVAAQGTGVLVGTPGPSRAYLFTVASAQPAVQRAASDAQRAPAARSVCGNGIVEREEQCDDGNLNDFDDCRNDCTRPLCCFIVPTAARYCDDGNPCTDDAFDAARGCVHTPNDKCCETSSECVTEETCRPCDGCFLYRWACCNGGAQCLVPETTDRCAGLKDGVGCDDDNLCTVGDGCRNQRCTGARRSCDDGRACTDDTCNAASGCIHAPTRCNCERDADCNDENPCTADACTGGTCINTSIADGTSCGSRDTCTGVQMCVLGQCVRSAAAGCFDRVRCACAAGLACDDGPVPGAITKPFEQGCNLITTAKSVAAESTRSKKKRVGKAKGMVGRAGALFTAAGKAARKQARRHLSPGCAASLATTITNAKHLAQELGTNLPGCTP
ncbi:MAG: DUF4215 domain-containing protein [Deltaproteobacteria bacterium]|nr:MAG: DUF4215 domain-containing protein [Deltaproteobacteria bacterium]